MTGSAQSFTTTNGNSVVNNVVIEGTGSPIAASTLKGAFSEGAVLEDSGFSADLTNAAWSGAATVTKDVVGLRGLPSEAFTVADTSAVASELAVLNRTIPDDALTRYATFRLDFDASPSTFPRLIFSLTVGTTPLTEAIVFNQSDGSSVETNSGGFIETVIQVGDFWFVTLGITNNSSGNTALAVGAYASWNTDGTATQDVAAQGDIVIATVESTTGTWSHSPIFTTGGSPFTRPDSTGSTLELANFNDPEGGIELEVTPFFDTAPASSEGILTPSSGVASRFLSFNNAAAKRIALNDSSNSTPKSNSWSAPGQTIKIKARWNDTTSKMQFSVDGVLSSEVAYDGSFSPSGALTFFKDLTLGAAVKITKTYFADLGQEWLSV